MKLLSKRFFGNKYFFIEHFNELRNSIDELEQVTKVLVNCYPDYCNSLIAIGTSLLFFQFINKFKITKYSTYLLTIL